MRNTSKVVPFEYANQSIRSLNIAGEPFFVGKDVCDILELKNSRKSLSALDEDEKLVYQIVTSGQRREVIVVNESGLYHLIFRSNKPEAKAFRKWVTSEVLPALRKSGNYSLAAAGGADVPALPGGIDLDRVREEALLLAMASKPGSRAVRLLRLLTPILSPAKKRRV